MELIFWSTMLGLWFIVVINGLGWIERAFDNYLDRWLVKAETNGEGDI